MSLFEENITRLRGKGGQAWLEHLPSLISNLAKQWELLDLQPALLLSFHYVLKGEQKGSPIVLKLGPMEDKAREQEAKALMYYQGEGCVQLLDWDKNQNALLLECLLPGLSLKSLFPHQDAIATVHAAHVIKRLHSASGSTTTTHFPDIPDWLSSLHKAHRLPQHLLYQAQDYAKTLLKTGAPFLLLHGDLHHDNILSHHDTWMAIDPHGVMGPAEYEAGAFIHNPMPDLLMQPHPIEIMESRIAIFSHLLGWSPSRMWQWNYVQTVLATCWMMEDNLDAKPWLELAKMIDCKNKEILSGKHSP